VLDCQEVTAQRVGFPGVQTIARLRRRVRRKGKKTTEIVYLIISLTLEELDAAGFLKLKRGYWVIESRPRHALDVSLGEDHSRVRNPRAAFALSLFRRVVVSFAQVWIDACRKPSRATASPPAGFKNASSTETAALSAYARSSSPTLRCLGAHQLESVLPSQRTVHETKACERHHPCHALTGRKAGAINNSVMKLISLHRTTTLETSNHSNHSQLLP
jgi:hypothetical protein